MTTRCATHEVTEFEVEHDYAKHPSLAVKKNKEGLCKNKIELLLQKASLDSEDEEEIDVDTLPSNSTPMYNKNKVQHQFNELEKYVTTKERVQMRITQAYYIMTTRYMSISCAVVFVSFVRFMERKVKLSLTAIFRFGTTMIY